MAAVLCCLALSACGSESGDTVSSSPTTTAAAPQASPSSTLSTSSPSPTSSASGAESAGQEMGAKIGFYAVAKAAGMTETAKMDELASGICTRIGSGKAGEVGPWMKDTFGLEGDVAAKVAVITIEVQCPEFKSKMGL
ncbi:hypothetical protein [Knoellia locipacati]|uniref:hypothetical protein n=1 Tax=Knoellia locipacati TaxID=882824 RepID=UPI0011BE04D6|nr:hypothetical protein [Knoellia locipacati]